MWLQQSNILYHHITLIFNHPPWRQFASLRALCTSGHEQGVSPPYYISNPFMTKNKVACLSKLLQFWPKQISTYSCNTIHNMQYTIHNIQQGQHIFVTTSHTEKFRILARPTDWIILSCKRYLLQPTVQHHTVCIKSHTTFHSDAFWHPLMPSSGSSFLL